VARDRLTFRRLSGLDRSGPPPAQTRRGEPLRVWTIPNAIGLARLALIFVFLAVALASDHGTDALPAVLFAVVAWGDYADGIAARVTGQYSRFGALLDPVVDRLLVISGIVVTWRFDLLPRWALAVLVARELFLLGAGRAALRRGIELRINWWGRLAVWPVMSALMCGLVDLRTAGAVLLYVGVAMSFLALFEYVADARRALRDQTPST
jgi:cardiolipin synthase (CMP-forming)